MKKLTGANFVMVLVILLIGVIGVLYVGNIQGWFDVSSSNTAFVEQSRGVVELLRQNVSYPLESKTVLRAGDKLTCQNGATAVIIVKDSKVIIGENAQIIITDPQTGSFSATVHTGEVFAHCETGATFLFEGKQITVQQATVLLSIRSCAQSVSVFKGSVGGAHSQQLLQFINGSESITDLPLSSLNAFTITQIRSINDPALCFTAADLDRLDAQRQQALQELIDSPPSTTEPATEEETTEDVSTEQIIPPTTTERPPASTPLPPVTEPPVTTSPTKPEPTETAVSQKQTCTIAIYCKTILNNMDDLEAGKAEFVPSNGVILYPVTVEFSEGETVFDVLKRVCSAAKIQLEYSWTPLYNSYYVEGIHNLYEFDCGFESGWMYKVNGWFPNYGCSSYTLKDGDVIVWAYTCKGLGTDVGAPSMG